MKENELKKFKQALVTSIKESENILKEAIRAEAELGHKVELNSLLNTIETSKNVEINSNIKSIGAVCSGEPEIMLELGLMAIQNNTYLALVGEDYFNVNECIFTLIGEVAKDMKIENKINYSAGNAVANINNCTEPLDKLVFIGSYFDYRNFSAKCKYGDVIFWNDNNIKVLMERVNFKKEYESIIKTAYVDNVEVEVYDDKDEFIEEVQDGEFAIIYAHENERQEILGKINPRIVEFDKFKIEDFKFNISEFAKMLK